MERLEDEPRPMSKEDFDTLVEENYQQLLGNVRSVKGMQKANAEDILHDVLERLRKTPEVIDANRNPLRWLHNALIYQVLRFRQKEHQHRERYPLTVDAVKRSEDSDETSWKRTIATKNEELTGQTDLELDVARALENDYNGDIFRDSLRGMTVEELRVKYNQTTRQIRWVLERTRERLARRLQAYAHK